MKQKSISWHSHQKVARAVPATMQQCSAQVCWPIFVYIYITQTYVRFVSAYYSPQVHPSPQHSFVSVGSTNYIEQECKVFVWLNALMQNRRQKALTFAFRRIHISLLKYIELILIFFLSFGSSIRWSHGRGRCDNGDAIKSGNSKLEVHATVYSYYTSV